MIVLPIITGARRTLLSWDYVTLGRLMTRLGFGV